jgi:hypothetical protein
VTGEQPPATDRLTWSDVREGLRELVLGPGAGPLLRDQ